MPPEEDKVIEGGPGEPVDEPTPDPIPSEDPDSEPPALEDDRIGVIASTLQGVTEQLAAMKERIDNPPAPIPAASSDPDDKYDYNTELFTNPEAALSHLKEEITAEVTGKLEGRYSQDQNRQRFWDDFYSANPDLKEHKWVVEATLSSEMGTLNKLQGQEAIDGLARATKERILSIQGGKSGGGNKTTSLTGAQSRVAPARRTAENDDKNEPKSLSAGIRELRRRKASVNN